MMRRYPISGNQPQPNGTTRRAYRTSWHFWLAAAVLLPWLSLHAPAQQAFPHAVTEIGLPDAPESQLPPVQSGQTASTIPASIAAGSIRGTVTSADGTVYGGAHVTLTSTSPTTFPARTAISDSDGQFSFDNVPSGAFKLTVSESGFATQTVAVVLHPGESLAAPAIILPFSTATSEVLVTVSQEEIAEEQVHAEEKQRVMGFIPNFYVVYAPNAAPLNARQKFHLAWRTSIDPITFAAAAGIAGVEQANNDYRGYGQGAEGYAKRFGASYGDAVIGNIIGGAILPSLFKQDPRYFYKGTGSIRSRALYAIAFAVMCKGDNGRWQVNYSGIIGGLAAGGISNLYYPDSDRNGASLTFENALIGTAGSAVGNLFQEFVVRKLTPKLPSYGPAHPSNSP
jgi:hypothetical protein